MSSLPMRESSGALFTSEELAGLGCSGKKAKRPLDNL